MIKDAVHADAEKHLIYAANVTNIYSNSHLA
jgi:hypothetical protein